MNDAQPLAQSDELADAMAQFGVATLYEAAGRSGLVDLPLTQLIPGSRVAGPARTAACAQDDNRAVHAAVADALPGEVLVLTMPSAAPVALVGELLATQAAERGVAGLLIDAAVRDVDELVALGLPIWTRYIRATGAVKDTPGRVNVPVHVGGTRIQPGDLVVMDSDGAVVVPRARIPEILDASRQRTAKEAALRLRFQAGEHSYDIYGMREADRKAQS